MGINPAQVSFAARIALLPLINDPAAIQQYVQGLPVQSAVLNPATSQSNPTVALVTQTGASGAAGANIGSSASRGDAGTDNFRSANSLSVSNESTSLNPASAAFAPSAGGAAGALDATGQKVNISV